MNAVKTNSCSRVWHSELCDIAPHAVAQILSRDIIIHNYDSKSITEIHIPAEKKLYPPLHLFRSNAHYEILISNTVNPNKNIWPYSSFNVIDLSSAIEFNFGIIYLNAGSDIYIYINKIIL